MRARSLRRLVTFSVITLAFLTSACANADAPLDVFRPAGGAAREADRLWDIVFPVAVAIFFIVEGLLVFAIFRFRRKPGREAKQFHGNTRLEAILTIVPALILAALAVPTLSTIFAQAEEPEGALQINVEGRQFWWRYEYTDLGVVTANELHVPVGQPIRLTLTGRDVIHSYWAPRLFGAQDVVPNRINHLTFSADETGTFLGQCKEFCGLSHANMKLRIIVQQPDEFEQWVADQLAPAAQPTDPAALRGLEVFTNTCFACHAVSGLPNAPEDDRALDGPNLTHFAARDTFAGALFERNDANLAAWIDDPDAVKPGALMPDYNLTQEQIDDVIAYLNSLE